MAALPGAATVGWVRINAKPLKQALSTWASKWVYLFTHYLQVGGRAGAGRRRVVAKGLLLAGVKSAIAP